MKFQPVKIVTNGDMSQGTVASIGININQEYAWSIQAVWTGTPTGNFTIQVSNDIVQLGSGTDPAANVVNWTTYTDSTQAAGAAAGTYMWAASVSPYQWVRLLYTSQSGGGSLNANYSAKG